MGIEIGAIVWGVKDIKRASDFWCKALDYVPHGEAADDWIMLRPRSGQGIQLSLKLVTSKYARRHHMDLFADNRDAEVERLLSLGATRKNWDYEPDADYTVLEDSDGNPFCVVQK